MHPLWLITNSRSGRLQLNNTGTYELGRQFPEVSDRTGNFAINRKPVACISRHNFTFKESPRRSSIVALLWVVVFEMNKRNNKFNY